MRILAKQAKSNEKARRILGGYHQVVTRHRVMPGRVWWRPQSGGPGTAKLYMLAFQPKKGELLCERDPILDPRPGARERELVLLGQDVISWFEERKGVKIEFCIGIRKRSRKDPVTDMWIFMVPWAYTVEENKRRRWWNFNREDMRELNRLVKKIKEE